MVRAIAAAMMFLEESGPDEVDPDAAVRGMENISHELLEFGNSDRVEFIELIERVSAAESNDHDCVDRRGQG